MPKAIRIHEYGGPEMLRWEEVEVGEPAPGQLRVRHAAVGLNYIDVYHRTGLYPLPSLPWTPGMEGRGPGRGGRRGRDRIQGRRPGRVCLPAGRRLRRGSADARRPGGGAAGRH